MIKLPYYHVVPNLNQTYHIFNEDDGTYYWNVATQYYLGSTLPNDSFDSEIMWYQYPRVGMDLRIFRPITD